LERAEHRVLDVTPWPTKVSSVAFVRTHAAWLSVAFLSYGLYFFAFMPSLDFEPSLFVLFSLLHLLCSWLAFGGAMPVVSASCLGSGLSYCLVVLPKLTTRVHSLGGFYSHVLQVWFRLAGLETRVDGNVLHFMYARGWNAIRVDPNWFGLWPFLLCTTIALPLVFASHDYRRAGRQIASRLSVCVLVVLPAFAVLKALLVTDVLGPMAAASPSWEVVLLSVSAAILVGGIGLGGQRASLNRKTLAVLGCTLVGMSMLLVGAQMTVIGPRIPMRVLVDNAHGTWEPTDVVMDEVNFGKSVTYTYSNLVDLLRCYCGHCDTTNKPLTADRLSGYSVVVLKTPSIPFQQAEMDAIWEYVEGGGSLFVLGDHTNLFGMSYYLNQVLQPYRVSFQYDDLYDLHTGGFNTWVKRSQDASPIASVMPARMRFETGSSISAPSLASDLLVVRGAGCEPLDWANPGFFGNISYETDESYGAYLSAVMVRAGKGRVIAFSDSTVLSNFSLFLPGRSEFALACVDLLSRSSLGGHSLNAALIAAGILIVGLIWRQSKIHPIYLPILLGLAALMSLAISTLHYTIALADFAPETPPPTIAFFGGQHEEGSRNWGTALGDDETTPDYSTFFVASQRLGLFPKWYEATVPDSETGIDAIVLLNHHLLEDKQTVTYLREQLLEGVSILILRNRLDSGEQPILSLLGPIVQGDVELSPGPVDLSCVAESSEGRGRVVVFDDMEVLSRAKLGKVEDVPTAQQLEGYRIAFALYKALVR